MSLGGASGYTNFAQPSDTGLLGQPLPQFTGDDPYSQIMALMPGFRNPYANASSGNALGGFDPSIYARNYSSTDAVNGGGGGGGGAGPIMGGASVGNAPAPVMPSPDADFPSTYVEPMPSPDADFPSTYVEPMPEDQYPYPSEPMQEPMVMPYEPAAYNYDQPAPAPMAMQEPMAMPYEPVSYNYDQPAEPAGGDFRGEMGGGDFGGGLEDTGEDSFDSAGYAKGGMVHGLLGPNPKGPDDGAGFLDRGEYVIRKSSVKKYGRGLLDMINEGKVPAKKIKSLLD